MKNSAKRNAKLRKNRNNTPERMKMDSKNLL